MQKLNTKAEATKLGSALCSQMLGPGWKYRVWENIGWHYAIYNGPMNVHVTIDGRYFALLSHEIPVTGECSAGGLAAWSGDTVSADPNEAVLKQTKAAMEYVQGLLSSVNYAKELSLAIVCLERNYRLRGWVRQCIHRTIMKRQRSNV